MELFFGKSGLFIQILDKLEKNERPAERFNRRAISLNY